MAEVIAGVGAFVNCIQAVEYAVQSGIFIAEFIKKMKKAPETIEGLEQDIRELSSLNIQFALLKDKGVISPSRTVILDTLTLQLSRSVKVLVEMRKKLNECTVQPGDSVWERTTKRFKTAVSDKDWKEFRDRVEKIVSKMSLTLQQGQYKLQLDLADRFFNLEANTAELINTTHRIEENGQIMLAILKRNQWSLKKIDTDNREIKNDLKVANSGIAAANQGIIAANHGVAAANHGIAAANHGISAIHTKLDGSVDDQIETKFSRVSRAVGVAGKNRDSEQLRAAQDRETKANFEVIFHTMVLNQDKGGPNQGWMLEGVMYTPTQLAQRFSRFLGDLPRIQIGRKAASIIQEEEEQSQNTKTRSLVSKDEMTVGTDKWGMGYQQLVSTDKVTGKKIKMQSLEFHEKSALDSFGTGIRLVRIDREGSDPEAYLIAGSTVPRDTALMKAVIGGDLADVKRELEVKRSGHIDDVDSTGWSAIMIAIVMGYNDIADYLIRRKARLNPPRGQRGALTFAVMKAEKERREAIDLILKQDLRVDPLTDPNLLLQTVHALAKDQWQRFLDSVLEIFQINDKITWGYDGFRMHETSTLLYRVLSMEYIIGSIMYEAGNLQQSTKAIVENMLVHGADPSIRAADGCTCLHNLFDESHMQNSENTDVYLIYTTYVDLVSYLLVVDPRFDPRAECIEKGYVSDWIYNIKISCRHSASGEFCAWPIWAKALENAGMNVLEITYGCNRYPQIVNMIRSGKYCPCGGCKQPQEINEYTMYDMPRGFNVPRFWFQKPEDEWMGTGEYREDDGDSPYPYSRNMKDDSDNWLKIESLEESRQSSNDRWDNILPNHKENREMIDTFLSQDPYGLKSGIGKERGYVLFDAK